MAGPPTTVWVEVATELLAEMGEWSEPVQVRIHDLRPNGQVEMEFRRGWPPGANVLMDLAPALRLLDQLATWWHGPTWWRRARRIWHRLTHPHADLLDRLQRDGLADDLILIHPHTGHVIALACPACGTWRTDPTAYCTSCGL